MTSACTPPDSCSVWKRACRRTVPWPLAYASASPSGSTRMPPVGKSGPGMTPIRSSSEASGFSASMIAAAQASARLCGGTSQAIDQPMPREPLTSRFGNVTGRTHGSCFFSVKFGWYSRTISGRRSLSHAVAAGERRASV